MSTFTYSISSDTATGNLISGLLMAELAVAGITAIKIDLDHANTDSFTITTQGSPSQASVDAVVNAHNGTEAEEAPETSSQAGAPSGTAGYVLGSVVVDSASGKVYLLRDTGSGGVWTQINVTSHTELSDVTSGNPHTQYQLGSEKGSANGYASLDGAGKVPASQLPISGVNPKGNWNASTNSPSLSSGTGTTGDRYRVSVAGSTNLDGETDWQVGDYAIFTVDSVWVKEDNSDAVASVNGATGAVSLDTTDIPEGTNQYYTEAKVSANSDVSANTTHRGQTNNPHSTDIGNLGSGTLSELNSKVTDATLDDSSSPRAPTAHSGTHSKGGSDPILISNLDATGLTQDTIPVVNSSGGITMEAKPTGGGIFGSEFEEVLGNSTVTYSDDFINAVTLSVSSIPAGKYRVGWSYGWAMDSTSRDFNARLKLDDDTNNLLMWHRQEPKDASGTNGAAGTDQAHRVAGFAYVTLTAGNHHFDLEFRTTDDDDQATIYVPRLEFWRVS